MIININVLYCVILVPVEVYMCVMCSKMLTEIKTQVTARYLLRLRSRNQHTCRSNTHRVTCVSLSVYTVVCSMWGYRIGCIADCLQVFVALNLCISASPRST